MQLNGFTLEQFLATFVFVQTRVLCLFLAAPFFSAKTLPMRIKVVTSLLITFLITPALLMTDLPNPISIEGVLLLVQQMIIGIVIGLIFQCIFQISIVAGQIIAMQSGLGFASFIDPGNQDSLPIISEFYLTTTLLMFLITNGHIYLISMIANSFDLIPIGAPIQNTASFLDIVTYFGDIFSGALSIAIPAIVALLTMNITMAIMTKAAPQLNLFTIGFPMMLIIGIFIMYMSYSEVVTISGELLTRGYDEALLFVGKAYV